MAVHEIEIPAHPYYFRYLEKVLALASLSRVDVDQVASDLAFPAIQRVDLLLDEDTIAQVLRVIFSRIEIGDVQIRSDKFALPSGWRQHYTLAEGLEMTKEVIG